MLGSPALELPLQSLRIMINGVTKENVFITLKKKEARNLKVNLKYNDPIKAHIKKDQKILDIGLKLHKLLDKSAKNRTKIGFRFEVFR